MPDRPLSLLLDQNIPRAITAWLQQQRPHWAVNHASEVGLNGRPDEEVFRWAQTRAAIVVTYDEDFADTRSFPLGSHQGIIRLRVWPTTTALTQAALDRLLSQVPPAELPGSLVIIDPDKIRLRRKP